MPTRRLAAFAALALVQICAAQPVRRPITQLEIMGLPDSTGVKIMLINSKGSSANCGESTVLTLDGPAPWRYDSVRKSFLVDLGPADVDTACWCAGDVDTAEQELMRQRAGIAVLAPGKALAFYPNQQRLPHPEAAIGAKGNKPVYSFCQLPPVDAFHIGMRARREVPLMVWTSAGKNIPSMARDEVANADWVLDKNLAGITLRPIFQAMKKSLICSPDDEDCCAKVTESWEFEPGSINVYYGAGAGNFTCRGGSAVFIHDVPILGDLAHELGHALGLFQSDNQHKYSLGHTTQSENFSCDNIMWEGTHFLKDALSPGQAFWTSQSCMSFVTNSGACLSCSEGGPSLCPAFTLGQRAPEPGKCFPTEVDGVKQVLVPRLLDHNNPPSSCDLPTSTYANGRATEDALQERYKILKAHVHGRADLHLGAISDGEFLDHWEPNFALNLAPKLHTGYVSDKAERLETIPPRIRKTLSTDVQKALELILHGQKPITSCNPPAPVAN